MMQKGTPYIFIFLSAIAISLNAQADTIYVDDTATGLNDGSSWENAYIYLQDALAVAASSDEIRVAQGTYTPDLGAGNTPLDQQTTFQLINGVAIKGGYAGYGQTDPNERDITLYESILNNTRPNFIRNRYIIITGSLTDETALLDGFTLTYGNGINGISSRRELMSNESGNPTIINCIFIINDSLIGSARGIAVSNDNSNPVFINCTFKTTSSSVHGFQSGGTIIENTSSSPIFGYCTFENNETAISNYDGSNPVLSNCNFINNVFGIVNRNNSNPSIRNWTFENNESAISNYDGSNSVLSDCNFINNGLGILNLYNSKPSINNCIFENNETCIENSYNSCPTLTECIFKNNNDIAIENYDSTVILYDCIFSDNSSSYSLISGGALTLYNCVLSGNTGYSIIRDSIGNIYNCTFYGNNCYANLIGHSGQRTRSENVNLTGCIIWNNTYMFDNNITVTYSNIQGGFPGQGNIDIDPLFAAPGYWADENNTDIVVDANNPNAVWIEGDYHLKSQAGRWDSTIESWVQDDVKSPCIDAGDPMDQLGPEPFPNGAVYNMGAYGRTEKASKSYFGSEPLGIIIPGDINGDGIVDTTDLEIVVNHWLMKAEDFLLTNEPPTVTLLSPQEGEQIVWPGPTLFMAQASDSDGQVVDVRFKLENRSASSTFDSTYINGYWQYEYEWNRRSDGPFGTWTAWAEATDDKGAKSESEKIQITLSSPD